MKRNILNEQIPFAHIVQAELLNPPSPITVNLIGMGRTGSHVIMLLGRMNYMLNQLNHPGLLVRVFDADLAESHNKGCMFLADSEIGLNKAVVFVNRVNRFFGTNWKAVEEMYDKCLITEFPNFGLAAITISCVDTVAARFEIAEILSNCTNVSHTNNKPLYWLDFGNGKDIGQAILSTVPDIPQPKSKLFYPVSALPMVTDEFKDVLIRSEIDNPLPGCSSQQSLEKQDLFINSTLANLGMEILWLMLKNGIIYNRGVFLDLNNLESTPLKIAYHKGEYFQLLGDDSNAVKVA